jgi:hypothetical protein
MVVGSEQGLQICGNHCGECVWRVGLQKNCSATDGDDECGDDKCGDGECGDYGEIRLTVLKYFITYELDII